MLTGFKTILLNLFVIMAVAGLQYLANVSWTDYLPLSWVWAAPMILGAINIALRFITTSPVFGRQKAG